MLTSLALIFLVGLSAAAINRKKSHNIKFDLKKYRMWAIMSAKYAVSGRRFHQGRFISLSGYLKYRKTGGNYGFRKIMRRKIFS